jgi:hypothetical protein
MREWLPASALATYPRSGKLPSGRLGAPLSELKKTSVFVSIGARAADDRAGERIVFIT